MKGEISKTNALILLFILIAIGGIVLYGENNIEYKQKAPDLNKLFDTFKKS